MLLTVAGRDPRLVERGVLHAFAAGDEVAVDTVDRAVRALNDRGVVERSGGLVFEVTRFCPGAAFVERERGGELVAALDHVVIDEQPLAARKTDTVQAG